jgi:hypothetical protein
MVIDIVPGRHDHFRKRIISLAKIDNQSLAGMGVSLGLPHELL